MAKLTKTQQEVYTHLKDAKPVIKSLDVWHLFHSLESCAFKSVKPKTIEKIVSEGLAKIDGEYLVLTNQPTKGL